MGRRPKGRRPVQGRLAEALRRRPGIGKAAERGAALYLRQLNYRILESNYRCRYGEIDLIAMDGETLVFVEVRARTSSRFGSPEESVDLRKQRQISKAALDYLAGKKVGDVASRFDVVVWRKAGEDGTYTLIRDAFDLALEL